MLCLNSLWRNRSHELKNPVPPRWDQVSTLKLQWSVCPSKSSLSPDVLVFGWFGVNPCSSVLVFRPLHYIPAFVASTHVHQIPERREIWLLLFPSFVVYTLPKTRGTISKETMAIAIFMHCSYPCDALLESKVNMQLLIARIYNYSQSRISAWSI